MKKMKVENEYFTKILRLQKEKMESMQKEVEKLKTEMKTMKKERRKGMANAIQLFYPHLGGYTCPLFGMGTSCTGRNGGNYPKGSGSPFKERSSSYRRMEKSINPSQTIA